MMDESERDRFDQMTRSVPDWLDYHYYLYIGAYPRRFHFSEFLRHTHKRVDVLEIEFDRFQWLTTIPWLNRALNEDVVIWQPDRVYEVVLWSHGPAVLNLGDVEPTLKKLESCSDLVITMCPWGKYDHGGGNIREADRNKTALYPSFFFDLGYSVSVIGKKDERDSNLLAWKRRQTWDSRTLSFSGPLTDTGDGRMAE